MKKLRIANASYAIARHFSILQELPFVSYQEHVPPENARLLLEGQVDIALIPCLDFALHGGYLGLDFGLASIEKTGCLYLYGRSPVQELERIFLYEDASASVLLLRLLLEERWKCAPLLVRSADPVPVEKLSKREGLLVRHEGPVEPDGKLPVAVDLGQEWYQMTEYPFTFLLWATRPGVLTVEQHRQLHETLHRAARVRGSIAADRSTEFGVSPAKAALFVEENFQHYLDRPMRDGLNAVFRRGFERGLLPRMIYQHPVFSLLEGHQGPFHEMTIPQVLEDAIDGRRISVADALRLVREASLTDLGLAADRLRIGVTNDRTVKYLLTVEARELENLDSIEREVQQAIDQGIHHILLLCTRGIGRRSAWETLIDRLKSRYPIQLEAIGIPAIISMAKREGTTLRETVTRLVTAGLDGVPSVGGGMLVDRMHQGVQAASYTAAEWLETAKWMHGVSARTGAHLRFDPADTWEDRLVHLHKLRSLQDLTPGFSSFHVEVAPDVSGLFPTEDYLRTIAISRIFLDNIHTIQEASLEQSEVAGTLGLCFGANELRFRAELGTRRTPNESARLLRALWESGIDLDQAEIPEKGRGEMH